MPPRRRKYPHLIARRVHRRITPLTNLRNTLAFQSALIRGDAVVDLHNLSQLPTPLIDHVRVAYQPSDFRHTENFDEPFVHLDHDSRGSDTSQPYSLSSYIPLNDWDGFSLEWVRIVGEGGFGLATLWEAVFEDGSRKKVVIKLPLKPYAKFDEELSWHQRYAGASHCVQSVDLQQTADMIRQNMGNFDKRDSGPRFNQEELGVLVLEYAEYGSFFNMLTKASYFNIDFPNRVLWEIWECLVKGVISVAYQPYMSRRYNPRELDDLLNSLDENENEADIALLRGFPISHDVHFDLEEQNVLVSEELDHDHNPIMKLHDFGQTSHQMRAAWNIWKEYDYWNARRTPKLNRIPPETITQDWDSIDLSRPGNVSRFTGENLNVGNPIAGRYGSWTNVYMIAKIMESVITKFWVSHPMSAKRYRSLDGRVNGLSYGWRLLKPQYSHVDPDLLDMVMQCQYQSPKDRPALTSLLRKVVRRKKEGFGEEREDVFEFWQDFWSRIKLRSRASNAPLGASEESSNGPPSSWLPDASNSNVPPASLYAPLNSSASSLRPTTQPPLVSVAVSPPPPPEAPPAALSPTTGTRPSLPNSKQQNALKRSSGAKQPRKSGFILGSLFNPFRSRSKHKTVHWAQPPNPGENAPQQQPQLPQVDLPLDFTDGNNPNPVPNAESPSVQPPTSQESPQAPLNIMDANTPGVEASRAAYPALPRKSRKPPNVRDAKTPQAAPPTAAFPARGQQAANLMDASTPTPTLLNNVFPTLPLHGAQQHQKTSQQRSREQQRQHQQPLAPQPPNRLNIMDTNFPTLTPLNNAFPPLVPGNPMHPRPTRPPLPPPHIFHGIPLHHGQSQLRKHGGGLSGPGTPVRTRAGSSRIPKPNGQQQQAPRYYLPLRSDDSMPDTPPIVEEYSTVSPGSKRRRASKQNARAVAADSSRKFARTSGRELEQPAMNPVAFPPLVQAAREPELTPMDVDVRSEDAADVMDMDL